MSKHIHIHLAPKRTVDRKVKDAKPSEVILLRKYIKTLGLPDSELQKILGYPEAKFQRALRELEDRYNRYKDPETRDAMSSSEYDQLIKKAGGQAKALKEYENSPASKTASGSFEKWLKKTYGASNSKDASSGPALFKEMQQRYGKAFGLTLQHFGYSINNPDKDIPPDWKPHSQFMAILQSNEKAINQTKDATRTKADVNEELADVLEMLKEAENDGSPASEVRALEREVAKLRAELLKTKDAGAFVSSKEIEQELARLKKALETAKRNGVSTTVIQGQIAEAEEELKKAKVRETKDADWSARHVGNFRFEVTTPQGKKISIGRAETSVEAIEKAKKLPTSATHDTSAKSKTGDALVLGNFEEWKKKVLYKNPSAAFEGTRERNTARIGRLIVGEWYGKKDQRLSWADSSFTGTEFGWKNKVKDSYPAASFRIRPAGKIVAKVGDKDVGEYDKQKGAGTIVDKTEDEQYKGYELKEFQPGKWMAKKGFSHFGPATSLQELKTKLDKHLAQIAKGGSAP